ncbi:TetR family transcriptional regulator [Nocardioides sp. ChNu-99]|nr:TetR family transcriptional regulator [Nocardioides sp. ChNu-99]
MGQDATRVNPSREDVPVDETETAPSPSRADSSRSRLVEAAVRAFAEKGFHGTTTRDIATGAQMSPAALYVHHRSKEELLFVISREGHLATLELLRRARAADPDPAEQLRQAVRDFAVHHARGHTRARIVNYELAALSEPHLAEINGLRRAIDAELRGIVVDGVATGRFACPDPRIAAAAVLSMGIDLARWYREGGGWSPEDVGERYAEIALRIVGA